MFCLLALSLLAEPRLVITSTTLDGITTTTEFKDLKLDPAKDFTQTFTVPERLAKLSVEDRAIAWGVLVRIG